MDVKELAEKAAERDLSDPSALEDYFEIVRLLESKDFDDAHRRNKEVRRLSGKYAVEQGSARMLELNKRALLFDAPHDFDAAVRYAEWNRDVKKRFYMPRRKQLHQIAMAMQRLEERKIRILGVMCPPGVGKALANDTKILTRAGWKKHGDIIVGDEVIGMDGEFKRVIAVHPKCLLDVLIELTNGQKIICHENHEWMVHDRSVIRHGHGYVIKETKDMERRSIADGGNARKRGHIYTFHLPQTKYIRGETKKLPVDPYLLGVWLGDGANKNPRIANTEKDKEIIEKIVSRGNDVRWETVHKVTGVHYYDFDIRDDLQKFGMCHSRKKTEKHIPEEYLTASVQQRLELLAGILDTDGSLSGNKYYFSTCDIELKTSFVCLVSTFGWRCSVNVQQPKESSSGVIGRKETFAISFCPDCFIPCALKRKQIKAYAVRRRIAIKSITRISPVEGNCITVEGDGMYLAGETMIPTHNTTLELMFMVWSGCRRPELSILMGSHSNSFLRGAYDEINRMLDPSGEYLWHEIFPHAKVVKTNAQDMRTDLEKNKRFETFEFSSIGSGNAGKVRASNLLVADDLVPDIESAMSRERMDKLWQQYYTDLMQRMIGDCAQILVQTPWSLHDPIDRLESSNSDNPEAEFIHLPALDENDESNFDYPYSLGFSTEMYHKQRIIMDEASWNALYMTQPVEREGQLYAKEELRRYFELPDREPDAILAACDTKDKGADYCVMPVAFQYGMDFYIDDVICDNGKPETVEARLAAALIKNGVHMARFESNSAGGKVAEKVQEEVKAKGGRTKITTKYSTSNKETRIIVNSPFTKEHFLFKDDSVIKKDKEYRLFLQQLCSYTMSGKNKNDDTCDAISLMVEFIQSLEANSVTVFRRPF